VNMLGNMGQASMYAGGPAGASPMMLSAMQRRKSMLGGPVPENAGVVGDQAQMMAEQLGGAVAAQRAMGGMMAPQPALGGMSPMAAEVAQDPQAMQGMLAQRQMMAMQAQQAGGPVQAQPMMPGAGGPAPRLLEARNRMAAKRAGGRMRPMGGPRPKFRR